MEIRYQEINEHDINIIRGQINTEEVNASGVIARCVHRFPISVLLIPVTDTPLPGSHQARARKSLFRNISNVIWLTCPYLNRKIHDLESAGYIDAIENIINRKEEYITLMRRAHAAFFYMRRSYLKRCCINWNQELLHKVSNTGIGGIRDIDNVKCLHIHYAHYLVCRDNIAGKITRLLLGNFTGCPDSICKKMQK